MRPDAFSIEKLSAVVLTPLRRQAGNVFSAGWSRCQPPAGSLVPPALCLPSAGRVTQQHHSVSVHPFQQEELP